MVQYISVVSSGIRWRAEVPLPIWPHIAAVSAQRRAPTPVLNGSRLADARSNRFARGLNISRVGHTLGLSFMARRWSSNRVDSSLRLPVLLASFFAFTCTALAQASPRGVVGDGAGPGRDARWTLAVSEFTSLLNDAGYQVDTVSPVDLPSAQLAPGVIL